MLTKFLVRGASCLVLSLLALSIPAAQRGAISAKPDTPFKLATFEAAGQTRIGLVIGTRVIDIAGRQCGAGSGRTPRRRCRCPTEMRALIEEYSRVSPRLYQIANYFKDAKTDAAPYRVRARQGGDQGADQIPVQPARRGRELQAARRRDVPARQPAAEGRERGRSGQGRSGLLRQVAALLHHRSRRAVLHSARTQHRLGRRARDHHRQTGVQRDRSGTRTTTSSATASCTTSAIAAAPAASR